MHVINFTMLLRNGKLLLKISLGARRFVLLSLSLNRSVNEGGLQIAIAGNNLILPWRAGKIISTSDQNVLMIIHSNKPVDILASSVGLAYVLWEGGKRLEGGFHLLSPTSQYWIILEFGRFCAYNCLPIKFNYQVTSIEVTASPGIDHGRCVVIAGRMNARV